MTVCRVILLVAMLAAVPLAAGAQFGGMPGLPGGPPGQPSGGLGGSTAAPPPACQALLELREEIQERGLAIQKANERKAAVLDACKLFKSFLAAEAQFIRRLEDNSRMCGVPADEIKRAKEQHSKAMQVAQPVCDAAARRSGLGELTLYDPSLYDPSLYNALRRDVRKPGRFGDYDDRCELCGKTGDFGWPRDFKPVR